MFFHKRQDRSFLGVALAMILVGAMILAIGVVGYLVNVAQQNTIVAFPSLKVIGGLIIIGIGYIQLELGLLRNK